MSIVIIDDNASNLVVLKHLAKGQVESPVITFARALDARDFLLRNESELIIVDCDMPELNGIEFTRVVRALERHKHTPIIMVTSHTAHKVRLDALAAGVSDFLTKPVNPTEFRSRVRNLLQLTTV